jgi:hypothetical protein
MLLPVVHWTSFIRIIEKKREQEEVHVKVGTLKTQAK